MKNIEDMNDYEVLCIESEADSSEIYMAYVRAKNALQPKSPASYALMPDDEKEKLRIRIEMAYRNLVAIEGNYSCFGKESEEADVNQQPNYDFGITDRFIKKKNRKPKKRSEGFRLDGESEDTAAKGQLGEAPSESQKKSKSVLMWIEKSIFIILLAFGMLMLFAFIINLIPDKNYDGKIISGKEIAKTKRYPIVRRISDPDKKGIISLEVAGKEINYKNQKAQEILDDSDNLKGNGIDETIMTENPLGSESAIYVVGKNESLSGIAEKDSVYKSAIKWTILYRMNVDKLRGIAPKENIPDAKLEQGLKLSLVTSKQFNEILKYRSKDDWIVNILSAKEYGKIVEMAIILIEKGYPVYITNAMIRGEEWMRLRVGFFKSKSEAEEKGKEIQKLIINDDYWCTQPGEKEVMDYGGYSGLNTK